MPRPVRKAVFPVAGLGTRSLPATKSVPKEMLTVVDRPIIQYAVDEARAAGIELFIFITSRGKTAIEDHFDQQFELYHTLERRGKEAQLAEARGSELPTGQFCFVRQPEPMGLGHAVWCARHIIGDDPFAVLLPDEVFLSRTPLLKQMMETYDDVGGNVVAVREVEPLLTARYGILDPAGAGDGIVVPARGMVEKPKPEEAPSTLSIVGRYLLQAQVLDRLDAAVEGAVAGAGGEIQLTDAMAETIGEQPFHGMRFEGERYDCGDRADFVAANLAFALSRSDLQEPVREAAQRMLDAGVAEPRKRAI